MKLSGNMRVRFKKITLSIGNGFDQDGGVKIPEENITVIKQNTKTKPKNNENFMIFFLKVIPRY